MMKTSDRRCKHLVISSDWCFGEKTIMSIISHGFVRQSKWALHIHNTVECKSTFLKLAFQAQPSMTTHVWWSCWHSPRPASWAVTCLDFERQMHLFFFSAELTWPWWSKRLRHTTVNTWCGLNFETPQTYSHYPYVTTTLYNTTN